MKEYSVIGKRVPRVDAVPSVTGRRRYVNDITLPGMLHGKILRSPYAHAKIVSIDTSKAERLPGVRAVISARDTLMRKFGGQAGGLPPDELALAAGEVIYIGQEVAAVAATDENTAEEALNLIEVVYEALLAVFDVEEAMKPGAPRVHRDAKSNVRHYVLRTFGDVDKGFKESDYIREDRFRTPMVVPAAIAIGCCVADFVPATGELTIYSHCQMPYRRKSTLAFVLGIPEEKLRLIRPYVGGSFGGSIALDAAHLCSAFLSMKTGKPVRVEYSRDEEFCTSRGRQPLIVELKTGVKKDGTLLAMQCRHFTQCGAYTDFGALNTVENSTYFDLEFRVPNVEFEGFVVYTNTTPARALRGLAHAPLIFAIHSHIDMIARDLGMDVVDLLLKNVHQKGDVTTAGCKLASCGISECIKEVATKINWKDKRGKLPANRGIGIGLASHSAGMRIPGYAGSLSTVMVHVNELGKVKVFSGRGEFGNAATTMLCMCVAEELGLRLEDISINEFVDTETIPWELGQGASRGTVAQGRAAIAAAQDVRHQLFEVVAEKLGAKVEDLAAKDGRIFVAESPTKGLSFKEAAQAYRFSGKPMPLIGRGHYEPPDEVKNFKTGEGNFSCAWGFSAHAAEVEVDTQTGQVKVLEVATADDCGKVLNPLHLEGSSDGGVLMGIGMALFEEIRHNEQGAVINPSFSEYGLPTALQTPKRIAHSFVESIDPYGPYGAKGITEVNSLAPAAAIANAIYDAVGVRIKELPITPERLLDALKKKSKA